MLKVGDMGTFQHKQMWTHCLNFKVYVIVEFIKCFVSAKFKY